MVKISESQEELLVKFLESLEITDCKEKFEDFKKGYKKVRASVPEESRCSGITKTGTRCSGRKLVNCSSGLCNIHKKAREKTRGAEEEMDWTSIKRRHLFTGRGDSSSPRGTLNLSGILLLAYPVEIKNEPDMDRDKEEILKLFNDNVKDIEINLENMNINHDGKEGHWLEKKMNIKHNSKNEPDINGYEMKKYSSRTTLGDYSASEYAFSGKNKRNKINSLNYWDDEIELSRTDFIRIFGSPKPKKNNRYSWSGSCVPVFGHYNFNGQILIINEYKDIIIYYSFSKDTRNKKANFPLFLHNDNIVIALWNSDKLKQNIDNKFNKNGFFTCKKINNTYKKICFGKAFDFEYFIECLKSKKIIFDSGMYNGNRRNYSQFRGMKNFWEELIIEEY